MTIDRIIVLAWLVLGTTAGAMLFMDMTLLEGLRAATMFAGGFLVLDLATD